MLVCGTATSGSAPQNGPTVGLCPGPYGGPGGGAVSYERGTPVNTVFRQRAERPTSSERLGVNQLRFTGKQLVVRFTGKQLVGRRTRACTGVTRNEGHTEPEGPTVGLVVGA